MAKKCDIAAGEEDWIRDIFINNRKKYDIQRKLLTETLSQREALNVALIDERTPSSTCTSCKYKGHFIRFCKSRRRNVNIVNNQTVDNTDFNPSDLPDVTTDHVNRECCGVINAWSECGQSENDDYSLLNVTTIFDNDGKEVKKLLNIGLGKENQVILNIQVDSASPVSFLKKNVLHELKF